MAKTHSHCERCAARVWKPCWWAFDQELNTPTTCDACKCWGCWECIKVWRDPITGGGMYLCSDCLKKHRVPNSEPEDCDCEFDAYEDEDRDEESWHYRRVCEACGQVWYGLHCPHEGYQNSCPHCGVRPIPQAVGEETGQ